jgi:hypothetical protein
MRLGPTLKGRGSQMQTKTTYWIDREDNPLIVHEQDSVLIEVIDLGQGRALDVFLTPALFGALRSAMDKAEQERKEIAERSAG